MDQHVTPNTLPAADAHDLWRGGLEPPSHSAPVLRLYLGALGASERPERLYPGTKQHLEFVSEPLARAAQLTGFLRGELAFACNRQEFDFSLTLFELTPQGEYRELCGYRARACQGPDDARPSSRAGRHLGFQSGRRLEHLLAGGSRLVVWLAAGHPDHGQDAAGGAREPLRVRWRGDSFVEVPLGERRFTR